MPYHDRIVSDRCLGERGPPCAFAGTAAGEGRMRIKLDENIATSAAVRLAALGYDVHTVIEEGLVGRVDSEVWMAAQTEERFLITRDLDFSDEWRFAAGSHAGVLLVRPRRRAVAHLRLSRALALYTRRGHLGTVLRELTIG
jgi:predicted nuclease of predicted toxin-antitoxin system